MHIINAMFGRGLGGIEQAFLDYAEALTLAGHEVTLLMKPNAAVMPQARAFQAAHKGVRILPFSNTITHNPLSAMRLRKVLAPLKANAAITHGGRAALLLRRAVGNSLPVVSLAHNYSLPRLIGSDAIFAITEDIARACREAGQPQEKIFLMPNMIRLPQGTMPRAKMANPPVIGSMGRFVEKKGFADYLKALSILKEKGIAFRAVLGGEGEEREKLKALSTEYGLGGLLSLPGWVEDKRAFFNSIDLFVLPSLHEPFGIVLLEAFAHGIPIISTDSEGPREIAAHGQDAFLVPKGDPQAMADAMATLLGDARLRGKLAAGGLEKVHSVYDIHVVAKRIDAALKRIVSTYEAK